MRAPAPLGSESEPEIDFESDPSHPAYQGYEQHQKNHKLILLCDVVIATGPASASDSGIHQNPGRICRSRSCIAGFCIFGVLTSGGGAAPPATPANFASAKHGGETTSAAPGEASGYCPLRKPEVFPEQLN